MDTLLLKGSTDSVNVFPFPELHPSTISLSNMIAVGDPPINCSFDHHDESINLNPQTPWGCPSDAAELPAPYSGVNPDGDIDLASDDCLKFISEILLEEYLDDQTSSLHDYTALQATERSLYDAIRDTCSSYSSDGYPSLLGQNDDSPHDDFHHSCSSHGSHDHDTPENMVSSSISLISNPLSYGSSDGFCELVDGPSNSPASTLLGLELTDEAAKYDWFEEACKSTPNGSCSNSTSSEGSCLINQGVEPSEENNHIEEGNGQRGRKNLTRDDSDHEEGRRNKHLATDTEDYLQMEQYDDVLLCKEDGDGNLCHDCEDGSSDNGGDSTSKGSKRKKTRSKKQSNEGELVDLTTLLRQCAQAVASFDLRTANNTLKQIRIHSSQHGDSTQRIAHYFANALEALLAGIGWQQYTDSGNKQPLSSEIFKAYREQVSAIPFRRASYFVANDAIVKLAEKASRIHVIDFGIFCGFQWPGLIQRLSKRPVGPPMLRITGIGYPERGFRPARKLEETGRRLAGYCERFKVPFKYQAIAKNWEDITPKDLNIKSDELLVVNCLYMSTKLLDETVEENSPKDGFLRLIRKLKPDLFIHATVNGTYTSPFFVTRFKEALFHYSAIFDMLEATIPRESQERLLVESHLYGRDALNVIACEGVERVERPETYRQWQVRIQRAGFRKLALDYELLKRVKTYVKSNHHKDFIIDEDSHWMLHGWKGRILYAMSCWRPA